MVQSAARRAEITGSTIKQAAVSVAVALICLALLLVAPWSGGPLLLRLVGRWACGGALSLCFFTLFDALPRFLCVSCCGCAVESIFGDLARVHSLKACAASLTRHAPPSCTRSRHVPHH